MKWAQIKVGPLDNFVYVFGDEDGTGAIVDPGSDADTLLAKAEEFGLRVKYVLLTHTHHDHVEAVDEVVKATGAHVVAWKGSAFPKDVGVDDGEELKIGSVPVRVLHTPGHKEDHVCYVVNNEKILTGDTLFIGECGRTDLPGSDPAEMWESLHVKLKEQPRHLEVCPGHDYGPTPTSTLEREYNENYTLEPRSKPEFIKFMSEP